MKIFKKVRYPNGRRHIYLLGVKIISYRKKQKCIYKNNQIFIIEDGVERPMHKNETINGLKIKIRGNNNTVKLELPIVAINSAITIENDNALVEIGSSPNFYNVNIDIRCGDGQICKIGRGSTFYGTTIKLPERSGCIIGTDCMFSNSINIWASDAHSVLDAKTLEILNTPTGPVVIGNHVWVGEGARITKRARIYDNSIVSGGAVCYRDYAESNIVIAGNPGTIVKRGITWDRPTPWELAQTRQAQINSIPHINRDEVDEKIKSFTGGGVDENSGRNPRIIMSLTSFPQRMSDIHFTLYSLLTQTLKPDMIVLWLGADKFPNKEADLPESVLQFLDKGLTIKWCDDIRSYTKLVPSLKEFPNDIIITVDDDIYYPDWLVEKLYNAYPQTPNQIHCLRAHKILFDKRGNLRPYNKWEHQTKNKKPSFLNFLTGVGGVLYPPHVLDKDVLNQPMFQKLAPLADDVWFWAMAVKNKTLINVVPSEFRCVYVNPARELRMTNEVTLAASNVAENKNDEQIKNVMEWTGIEIK